MRSVTSSIISKLMALIDDGFQEAELFFEMRRVKMEDERKAVHEKRGVPSEFVKALQSKAKRHQGATEMLVIRPDDEDVMLALAYTIRNRQANLRNAPHGSHLGMPQEAGCLFP